MARPQVTKFLTAAEVHRRLRAVKEYLQSHKNQRIKFLCTDDKLLPFVTLDYYDSEDEYNFISASPINREHLEKVVALNRSLFKESYNYDYFSVGDYVNEFYAGLSKLFSITCMHFLDKNGEALIKCVICLGSVHHAPRILFYNTNKKQLMYEKLIAYSDLQ